MTAATDIMAAREWLRTVLQGEGATILGSNMLNAAGMPLGSLTVEIDRKRFVIAIQESTIPDLDRYRKNEGQA